MDNSKDIEKAFIDLAIELTVLIKLQLRKEGLYKTGALDRSIKVSWIKRGDTYELVLDSLDYFDELDEKFGILEAVFRSPQYQIILDKIVELNAQALEDSLLDQLSENNEQN